MDLYHPVIGLEVHVELKTNSKMFCECEADYFGKKANSNTCPVCLGLPGALPVPNERAIEWTILIGKALNCSINPISKFDRKHYFYPDLPKGYQISQYDEPIAVRGYFEMNGRRFGITRVHLEEDTGKLMHVGGDTLVDFNRSGVPLVEIVTEPDFDDSNDVKKFLEELHAVIEKLGVSDADMEKGSMRLEPNISVSTRKKELPKYKVEVKNINSFNFVKRAIDYEVVRQTDLLKEGKTPEQETRGYIEKTNSTASQRSKEEAHDYRYFPEPDIPPLIFKQQYIQSITVPELPLAQQARYMKEYHIKKDDALIISHDSTLRTYFEELVKDINIKGKEQLLANILRNKKISIDLPLEEFKAAFINKTSAKTSDISKLAPVIENVIKHNQKVVDDYRKGKQNAIMYLVGQVMREMKGQADATRIREELLKEISKS